MSPYIYSDYAWLGVDAVGHVAVFTTAGIAPIPSAVLSNSDLVDLAEELVKELPVLGEAELMVRLPRPDDYLGFASRGLFAFDWQDAHRRGSHSLCYEVIAKPKIEQNIERIGGHLKAVANLVAFTTLSFAEVDRIPVERLIACQWGGSLVNGRLTDASQS